MKKIITILIILLTCSTAFAVTSADSTHALSIEKVLASLPATFPEKPQSNIQYQFTTDYYQYEANGNFENKERVSSYFIKNSISDKVTWSDVTIAHAQSFDETFGSGQSQDYMDGFSYSLKDVMSSFSPEFFKGFPDLMESKSLVWDVGQIELFGTAYLSDLKLDVPFKPNLPDAQFPGGGSFHNTQAQITWIGVSKVDGKLCAQIEYDAPFNSLNFHTNGVRLNGQSRMVK
jgi:hypothetical protein